VVLHKENTHLCINHKNTDFTPIAQVDIVPCGFGPTHGPWIENRPTGGGYDAFGVRWVDMITLTLDQIIAFNAPVMEEAMNCRHKQLAGQSI